MASAKHCAVSTKAGRYSYSYRVHSPGERLVNNNFKNYHLGTVEHRAMCSENCVKRGRGDRKVLMKGMVLGVLKG